MRKILVPLLLAAALAGCASHDVYDARGPSEFCEIHHALMHSEKISPPENAMPPQDYLEARVRFFPHAYPFFLPETKGKYMVYICDDCVRAEEIWKSRH